MAASLTITAASVAADGRSLTINVGGIGTGPLLPASGAAGFTVTNTTTGWTQKVVAATAGASTVAAVLPYQVSSGDVVTLSYAPGTLTDSAATPNTMPALGPVSVTSASTAVAPNLTQIASGNFATATGLQGWWKADSIAQSDGSAVASWADSSGSAHTLSQATAGNQPVLKLGVNGIRGKAAIQCSGGQFLAATSLLDASYGQSVSVYIVSRISPSQGLNMVISANSGSLDFARGSAATLTNTLSAYPPSGGAYSTTSTGFYISGPSISVIDDDDFLACQSLTYDGVTALVASDGHVKTNPTTSALAAAGPFAIGGRPNGSFGFNGLISEVLICNAAHSTTLRKAIESGLRAKYTIPYSKQIIHQGDSITGTSAYPGQMLTALTKPYFNYDASISGQTVAGIISGFAAQEGILSDRSRPRNILAVWCGTNDLSANSTTADGTALYNALVTYCRQARAAGYRVIPLTMLPRSTTGTFEAQARPQFNSLIRANWATFADGIADVGNDATIGQSGQNSNATYYADGTHLNNTGGAIVASYVDQAILGGTAYAQNAAQPGVDNALFAGALALGTPAGSSVSLSWAAATGGTGPYTYQVQRAPDVSGTPGVFAAVGTAGSALSYNDAALSPATAYWYQVQATDSTAGTPLVNYSAMPTVTTTSALALACPAPSITPISATSLSVSWGGATGGTAPYTYQLQRSTSSGGTFANVAGATASPFTDTALSPGTAYYYKVIATDAAAAAATSAQGTGTTSAALTAGTVTVAAQTSTSLTLTSTAPTGGTAPYTYKWYRNTTHVSFVVGQVVSGATGPSLTDTGLAVNTAYFYVCQYGDAAAGAINSLEVQTATLAAPVQVTGLAAALLQVPLSWSAVSGATSYRLYRNGSLIASPSSISATDALASGTAAVYTVSAVDGGGTEGPQSTGVTAGASGLRRRIN